jgi:O-antigen/teichoic acid export membrane protein
MKQVLLKLIKQAGIYGLGDLVTNLISFLLIPLYTSYLTPADYGVLQICNISEAILIIIMSLGITSSFFKIYFESKNTEYRKQVIGTAFSIYTIFSLTVTCLMLAVSYFYSNSILGIENRGFYLLNLITLGALFQGYLNLVFANFRAEEKPQYYAIVSILKVLLYTSMNIYFITVLQRNYFGIKEVRLISVFISLIITIPYLFKKISFKFNVAIAKKLLQIGVPLGIGAIATWVLNLTDRYMIKLLLPDATAMSEVGLYSFGDKYTVILKFLIVFPFMQAWGPLMYSYQNDINAKTIYKKIMHYYSFVAGIILLFFVIFAQDLISVLARSESYIQAYKVVPILAFSKLLIGLYVVFTLGVTLTSKTKHIAYSNFLAASINIVLNFFLIIKFGIFGAALASLIAHLIRITYLYHKSQKYYFINWEIKKLICFLIFIFFVGFITNNLNLNIFVNLLIFCLSVIISFVFRLVSFDDIIKANTLLINKLKQK